MNQTVNQTVENWDDADNAMRRMGEIDIARSKINADLTLKINNLKEKAKKSITSLEKERMELEKKLKRHCSRKKSEFAEKRSRVLNYGTIGYRVTSTIPIPRAKDRLADLIQALKQLQLDRCIKTVERADRALVATLDDETIVKLGLTKRMRDSIRIEPNIEKIQGLGKKRR